MSEPLANWAGNVHFQTDVLHRPASVEALQRLVALSDHVRAVGAAHSFSPIADTAGVLVSLDELPHAIEIDGERSTVSISGGVRYSSLVAVLDRSGHALANLPSTLPFTVVGACATGTHGSGSGNGALATSIAEMDIVVASGKIVTLGRAQGPTFFAAPVGLGALGIVSRLTLDLVPSFQIEEYEYEALPRSELAAHFDEIFGSGYSVSLFTDWQDSAINSARIKRRVGIESVTPMPSRWMGAHYASPSRIPGQGAVGPWFHRLPHEEIASRSRGGTQTEYFVPRAAAEEAIELVASLAAMLGPVLKTSEIRTVKADQLWLSPCYGVDTVAIHFSWKDAITEHVEVLGPVIATLERVLEPLQPRPHWGKLFSIAPEVLERRYDRLPEFRSMVRSFDPDGKFRNDFLSSTLGFDD